MTIAEQYARALYALVEKDPAASLSYLKNLEHSLERRGHRKLLPQVFSAYQTLDLARKRAEVHRYITPAQERTRVLLQLYKKLIAKS